MHPNSMQCTKTWVRGPMGLIGCVRCEKSRRDFVAWTFALTAPVHPVLHRVWCSYELIPDAPKHCATHKNMSFYPMGQIGCVRCEKSQCDIMARTFVLIAPVHPVLHRVSCSNETIPNAPKRYVMHQNMSLGSNGVDWVHSLRKITTRLCGTNFCINCTSSHRFTPSFMQLRNDNRWTQNTMKLTKTWV